MLKTSKNDVKFSLVVQNMNTQKRDSSFLSNLPGHSRQALFTVLLVVLNLTILLLPSRLALLS